MPKYIAGTGPLEPKLMIIGEAPGQREDLEGIPFVGPSGQILDECLFKAGISRSDCYITNVVKYRPPFNDFEKLNLIGVDLEEQINSLWDNEIRHLRPNCILAAGDKALQAVTGLSGILNYRGSILLAKDGITKVVPTIHPSGLFSKAFDDESDRANGGLEWTYLKFIESDIRRAVEESQTKEINLPSRTIEIARNSLDLMRFFREYENADKMVTDIESINCVPVCIGFAFNRSHAISVPLLRRIGNVALTDMGDSELDEVWRMIYKTLAEKKVMGHNLMYDEFKLSRIGFDIPNVYSDTLIKVRVVFPELPSKTLGTLTSLWTREPYYKSEGKEFRLGKDKIDQLLIYNGKDCAVDFEIDEELEKDLQELASHYNIPLVDYYYNYMMKKHKFYLMMQNTGFRVDWNRQKELYAEYTRLAEEAHKHLTELCGDDINVNSPPQVKRLLYQQLKFKHMKRNPTSEETIVRLMSSHAKRDDQKKICAAILNERRIKNQKSRYLSFHRDYDNRCKSVFNISSTETTRSSTGILKKPLRPKKIGLAFHTISKHGKLAKDIRSMLICDPGMVMIAADASQAEARVVAVLSEDYELLRAFDEIDIHRRTAGLIFGFADNLYLSKDYKNELVDSIGKDSPERFTGKKVRHAGNYDMKKGTFMEAFNTDAQKFEIKMTISEWKAGQMLELFHAASPRIKNVFHQQIKDAIDSSRVLIDPFGGIRVFNGRLDDSTYREGFANIPQRTVGHLVQGAALKVEEELNGDLQHLWYVEAHDALVMGVPANNWEPYAKLLKKHLECPIDFSTYCTLKRDIKLVIPCEVELSETHYGAFKKVKI